MCSRSGQSSKQQTANKKAQHKQIAIELVLLISKMAKTKPAHVKAAEELERDVAGSLKSFLELGKGIPSLLPCDIMAGLMKRIKDEKAAVAQAMTDKFKPAMKKYRFYVFLSEFSVFNDRDFIIKVGKLYLTQTQLKNWNKGKDKETVDGLEKFVIMMLDRMELFAEKERKAARKAQKR